MEDQRLFGFIGDISIGGMMINTHREVKVGSHVNLSIELPQDISEQTLDVRAEIAWVDEGDSRNSRDCGCRFIAIKQAARDALLELARKYPMGEEEL